jgi:hypothetical protein
MKDIYLEDLQKQAFASKKTVITEAVDPKAKKQLIKDIDSLIVAVNKALEGHENASLADIDNSSDDAGISLQETISLIKASKVESDWFAKEAIITALKLNA